ncbi:MAG: hypothetical protein Q9181_000627 [Wetmoreana brouardii]
MAPPKQAPVGRTSDDDDKVNVKRPSVPHHRRQEGSTTSTETVLHRPQTHRENVPPASNSALCNTNESYLPRTVIGLPSGIPQVIGYPLRDPSATSFPPGTTQEANWPLPDSVSQGLKYQAKHYAPRTPQVSGFAKQSRITHHIFDPDFGPIYSHCTECDPSGGPTDCQHPEDPGYSTSVNPVPKDDPAFQFWERLGPQITPKKASPPSKLISKPSPSKATVVKDTVSLRTPDFSGEAGSPPSGLALVNRGRINRAPGPVQYPDEMLAARHLSNFLTENVQDGVATSYMFVFPSPLDYCDRVLFNAI